MSNKMSNTKSAEIAVSCCNSVGCIFSPFHPQNKGLQLLENQAKVK